MRFSELLNRLRPYLLALALVATILGIAAPYFERPELSQPIWQTGAAPVLAVLILDIILSLAKGRFGLDLVAALSMSAALWFGETLAAAVVALMYSGGQVLENYAANRARRELTALLERAPREAMRQLDGRMELVPIEDLRVNDRVLVRHGDVVPTDGTLREGRALLDLSALTGESLPQSCAPGSAVQSGVVNMGDPFSMTVARLAKDSAYAGIVRLVQQAQQSRAPMVRMADRYALVFLVLAVGIAVLAGMLTGDPVRAVAVLVVATPCPLILAVPVALVSGVSRAARDGVLIKGGAVLEAIARVAVVVFDKTGTITGGQARLVGSDLHGNLSENEALQLAASLDQVSQHSIARALVMEAADRGLKLDQPQEVRETAGEGLEGRVKQSDLILGGRDFVARRLGTRLPESSVPGKVTVALALDNVLVAELHLADRLREGVGAMIAALRKQGIERIVLATGDRVSVTHATIGNLEFDHIHADLSPTDKIAIVNAEKGFGVTMMIGDGVNDAPALAAADVGVAMGARGAAASAESADVVLLVDDPARVLEGLAVARYAIGIARQSVIVGLGLSITGMLVAAAGYLTPVEGAVLQEVIDVAVVLNALRPLRMR